ncbi:hypothetical protein CTER_1225, partial [Ruminiclostridium cellobioparum subsp. termitidis CT1112]
RVFISKIREKQTNFRYSIDYTLRAYYILIISTLNVD